ncbi:DNA alkylation repair enzyme [uncultured archaeon]|nr:DNA alkylation repair enzyme [uncultured archaeon]
MSSSKCNEILEKLKSLYNPKNVEGAARFGINSEGNYGVSIPVLRKMAREIGKNHEFAQELWACRVNDTRILACYVDEPKKVTEAQMEAWVKDFNSWDVCDQVCGNLFDRTEFAHKKAIEWSSRKEEFVKRAGFVLMATLAVHDKQSTDAEFLKFLPIIKRESIDERNFVKKSVNWALRQIGKRNAVLNKKAIEIAKEIQKINSKSACWIANDAIRELESDAIRKKLN